MSLQKSQWETIFRYHKSIPSIVSEKSWNKGGQREHHDACYVAAAVGQKAHLKTKRRQAVKKSSL